MLKIYTGNVYGDDLERVRELGLGVMIASTPSNWKPTRAYKDLPCALDNGAYQAWELGYPFMPRFFWQTMEKCYSLRLKLDFIVIPDLVAGGPQSLRFSLRWMTEKLRGCKNLAIAVQDGMDEYAVDPLVDDGLSHIFVGGTLDWKKTSIRSWARFAHDKGLQCHVGRCGTLAMLDLAEDAGADSADSVNFVRNDSWETLHRYLGKQPSLFPVGSPRGV